MPVSHGGLIVKYIFNEQYFATGCEVHYSEVKEAFERIADRIVKDFNPRTVLDAGCAWGYLVASLRDRGVEAYGIDISEYAISRVREDMKQFCASAGLTKPLPDTFPVRYDLIVNIEVLEHMHEDEGLQALAQLCRYGDTILFSSSPDDVMEDTHYNVQQVEYWARHFAEHGFFRILDYDAGYVAPQALLLRKVDISLGRV